MKKIFLFALFAVSFCYSATAQQNNRDSIQNSYKQEFLSNTANFAVGGFEVGYGKVLAGDRNIRFFGGYYYLEKPVFYDKEELPITIKHKNMNGARFEAQYLFFKPAKNNFRYFGGGYAILKTIAMDVIREEATPLTTTTVNYTAKGTALGFGIMGGFRNYILDNIFFDIYVGGGVMLPLGGQFIDDVHLDVLNPYKRSINPRAGITFGCSF